MKFSLSGIIARRLMLTVLALLAASIISFIVLANRVHENTIIHTDVVIIELIRQFHSDMLDKLVVIATDLASSAVIAMLAAMLTAFLWYKRKRQAALFTIVAIGGAIALVTFLKLVFLRDRPDLWVSIIAETGYSFPSGHATASSILGFTTVVLLWPTKWRWYAIILAGIYIVGIGFTRVYLGVHYPTDIIAAWSMSLAWVIIVKFAMDYSFGLLQHRRNI